MRKSAAGALGHFSKHKAEIIPVLIDALKDKDADVRRAAVIALGRLGKGSSKVEAALEQFSKGVEDSHTKNALAIARAFMGKTDPASTAILLKAASDSDRVWHEAGTDLMETMARTKPKELLPGLMKMLEKGEKPGTINAMKVLRRMKGAAAPALPLLAKLYDEGDDETRREVIHTITRVGKDDEITVQVIGKAFSDKDSKIRREALIGFMRLHKRPESLYKPLLERLDDKDKTVRLLALAIVRGKGSKIPGAVPKLIKMAEAKDDDISAPAIRALGSILPTTPEIIQAISKGLWHGDKRVRRASIGALRKVGRLMPEKVVPILEKASKLEKDKRLKLAIERALSHIKNERNPKEMHQDRPRPQKGQ